VRARRWVLCGIAMFVIAVIAFFGWIVVFPHGNRIGRTNLVVVLGPYYLNDRMMIAQSVLAVSPGAPILVSKPGGSDPTPCPTTVPGAAAFVCFLPVPYSTRGEARFAAHYALEHHYTSMTVVAPRAQLTRAKIRFSRCWPGRLTMVEAPESFHQAVDQFAYQSAAIVKAETVQRSC
jgi:hypothetical protein